MFSELDMARIPYRPTLESPLCPHEQAFTDTHCILKIQRRCQLFRYQAVNETRIRLVELNSHSAVLPKLFKNIIILGGLGPQLCPHRMYINNSENSFWSTTSHDIWVGMDWTIHKVQLRASGSWDTSLGIAMGCELNCRGIEVRFPAGIMRFFSPPMSRPVPRPT